MAAVVEGLRERLLSLTTLQADVLATGAIVLALSAEDLAAFVQIWAEVAEERLDDCRPCLYVANDAIQKSKAAAAAFAPVLPKALASMNDGDAVHGDSIRRVVQLWSERGLFDAAFVAELKRSTQAYGADGELLGELPDATEDDGTGGARRAHSQSQDLDEEEEEEDAADGEDGHAGPAPMLARNDSSSIQGVSLPKLVVAAKGTGVRAMKTAAELNGLVLAAMKDFAETSKGKATGAGADAGAGAGAGKSAGGGSADFAAHLSGLDDDAVAAMRAESGALSQRCCKLGEVLRESVALEGALITAIEFRVGEFGVDLAKNAADMKRCDELEALLQRLRERHAGEDVLETVAFKVQRVAKSKEERKRARKPSIDSDDDDDDDGDGEDDEEADGDGEDGGGEEDMFGVGAGRKKRKRRKKKKKVDAPVEAVPMLYNKYTKQYVPMPKYGDAEDWRD